MVPVKAFVPDRSLVQVWFQVFVDRHQCRCSSQLHLVAGSRPLSGAGQVPGARRSGADAGAAGALVQQHSSRAAAQLPPLRRCSRTAPVPQLSSRLSAGAAAQLPCRSSAPASPQVQQHSSRAAAQLPCRSSAPGAAGRTPPLLSSGAVAQLPVPQVALRLFTAPVQQLSYRCRRSRSASSQLPAAAQLPVPQVALCLFTAQVPVPQVALRLFTAPGSSSAPGAAGRAPPRHSSRCRRSRSASSQLPVPQVALRLVTAPGAAGRVHPRCRYSSCFVLVLMQVLQVRSDRCRFGLDRWRVRA
ncbi:uncharacterized protein LOC142984732 [Anticarsia gemmatalis]|uniref:uncharacterized protein LOC142984732 n=1 Tax=Anticarsia gemmatalis TaxID=129554 RepID=UPI003F75BDAC